MTEADSVGARSGRCVRTDGTGVLGCRSPPRGSVAATSRGRAQLVPGGENEVPLMHSLVCAKHDCLLCNSVCMVVKILWALGTKRGDQRGKLLSTHTLKESVHFSSPGVQAGADIVKFWPTWKIQLSIQGFRQPWRSVVRVGNPLWGTGKQLRKKLPVLASATAAAGVFQSRRV